MPCHYIGGRIINVICFFAYMINSKVYAYLIAKLRNMHHHEQLSSDKKVISTSVRPNICICDTIRKANICWSKPGREIAKGCSTMHILA